MWRGACKLPLLVAALLRITLMVAAFTLAGTTVMTQDDTTSYLNPGRNLILHSAFITAVAPEIDRTPGYPLFAEITGMAWDNVLLTVTVQIVLSLISLLLLRKIADRIFTELLMAPYRPMEATKRAIKANSNSSSVLKRDCPAEP
jgi:hypothetical protein